jgi:hypothetical protein
MPSGSHTGKKPECAAAVVHNDVLHSPGIRSDHRRDSHDNGREFADRENIFEIYLPATTIEHRRT